MSHMKRFLEEVMTEMGKSEIDDEVTAEAQRRLDAVEIPKKSRFPTESCRRADMINVRRKPKK